MRASKITSNFVRIPDWKLRVEFVEEENEAIGIFDDSYRPIFDEYRITEAQINNAHEAIHEVLEKFGLPRVGDYIQDSCDVYRVVEVLFNFGNKTVFISLV